jgi:PAS domain S-box-containing protein
MGKQGKRRKRRKKMSKLLSVLIVEDSEDDALLMIRELKRGGYESVYERVETAEAMRTALQEKSWDVILCDYQMPQFNGFAAIALLKETGIDLPLIIVSGVIGEETAVECMRLGAHDYVMKNNLSRLVPAIERELKEAESRNKRGLAEKALKRSEEKYRNILKNMDDVYYELDLDGNLVFFNDAMISKSGYSHEELMGMNYTEYMSPHMYERALDVFTEIYRTGKSISFFDYEIIMKGGQVKNYESWASLLFDNNNQPIGFSGIARDITERKRVEEQLQQTLDSLRKAFGTMVQVMVSAVETRDPYTAGHQSRAANLARAIATEMGLSKDRIDGIRMAGSIHDVGKLSIPSEILSKPARLSGIEFPLIKEHARTGYEILKNVESPWPLADIIYQHHERMDGSGYPRNLKGDDIIIEARILAVADVMESMTSHRPYRPALGMDAALNEIMMNRAILYDAAAVDACLRLFHEKGYKMSDDGDSH